MSKNGNINKNSYQQIKPKTDVYKLLGGSHSESHSETCVKKESQTVYIMHNNLEDITPRYCSYTYTASAIK